MHRLIINLDGKPDEAPMGKFTNCLRGYCTFAIGPFRGKPFGRLGRPFTLALLHEDATAKRTTQFTMSGVTRSYDGMLSGHSCTGLLDVARRSHRFETAAPEQFIPKLKEGYPASVRIECAVKDWPKKPIEQHDQTDFEFLCHAVPPALIYDTGEVLKIEPQAKKEHKITSGDLPDGPGEWSADVSNVALSAAAHGLDPGEHLKADVKDLEGLAAHKELGLFLADVKKFRGLVPAAKFLTTGRTAEGLRKKLMDAFKRQLAHAVEYTFRTTNGSITVGTRLTGLSDGPLVVAATEGQYADGEFLQEVTAVPEPLAAYWGHEPPPRAEVVVLATVAEGNDPTGLGRVPVVFADQPSQVVWARGATLHAAPNFQVSSQFVAGEEVVVAFLHANPGAPVVLGSVFHGKNPPKKVGQKEILLQCGKLTLKLTDAGFSVLIGSNSLVVNDSGITLKTKKHSWELK